MDDKETSPSSLIIIIVLRTTRDPFIPWSHDHDQL